MTDATAPDATQPERLPRPRIRTGAVIWGLLLAVAGALALHVAITPGRREEVLEAVLALDGFGWTVVTVVAIGGTVTFIALAAVIRRAQHRLSRR